MIVINSFIKLCEEEKSKKYFKDLIKFVNNEYKTKNIFPKKENIFQALKDTPYEKVKAVIIGQDPYHGEGQANGLCFSVNPEVKIPRSLKNIYKEINRDLGLKIPNNGCLTSWAKEGVLLLNTILTVEEGKAGSHKDKGWEIFTDRVIEFLNEKEKPIVFLLWGDYAKEKASIITNSKHLILKSTHPSPFSSKKGFDGCSHFSMANQFLVANGETPINWEIKDIKIEKKPIEPIEKIKIKEQEEKEI